MRKEVHNRQRVKPRTTLSKIISSFDLALMSRLPVHRESADSIIVQQTIILNLPEFVLALQSLWTANSATLKLTAM